MFSDDFIGSIGTTGTGGKISAMFLATVVEAPSLIVLLAFGFSAAVSIKIDYENQER
jgi:hypothetical protein